MLRQGSAAGLDGGADLLLRVHLLPRLRRGRARRALSELRRRTRASADPPGRPAGAPSRLDQAHRQSRRLPGGVSVALGPSRRGLVPPFIAMDVLRAANAAEAAGRHVIHLEVGQPGTQAPSAVREAAARALAEERI